MTTPKIGMLLLLGSLTAAGTALSQEPPPYQGGDQAQPGDEQMAPDDTYPQPSDVQAPPDANDVQPGDVQVAPDASYAQPGDEQAAPRDPEVAGVEYFHQRLSPYGRWVERPRYGYVWVPRIRHGWRPYTTGHWIYTDQGWAWVADEPWGWAAFHYGRWFYDPVIGWAWVPGTVWAPAWVAWRHGGGYLGWAPLSPAVGFSVGVGLSFGGGISAGYYTFVGERDILAPRVATVILPSSRNVTIVNNTTNITNYTVVNNRIVNNGVNVQRIEQVTGRPVQRVQVAALASASAGGHPAAFYQPPVVARAAQARHAEFGRALPAQVAVQQRSRVFARSAAGATPATGANARGNGANNAPGGGATGAQATNTVTGRRTPATAGTAGRSTTGTGGRRTTATSGQASAGGTRPPHHASGAPGAPSLPNRSGQPSGPPRAGQPPSHPPQHQHAPPPDRKKAPPPPPPQDHKPPPVG